MGVSLFQTEADVEWLAGAGSVADALRILAEEQERGIGLVVLDLNLGDGDGWQIVDDLQRRKWTGRVVLVTGRIDAYSLWRSQRPPVVAISTKRRCGGRIVSKQSGIFDRAEPGLPKT